MVHISHIFNIRIKLCSAQLLFGAAVVNIYRERFVSAQFLFWCLFIRSLHPRLVGAAETASFL